MVGMPPRLCEQHHTLCNDFPPAAWWCEINLPYVGFGQFPFTNQLHFIFPQVIGSGREDDGDGSQLGFFMD